MRFKVAFPKALIYYNFITTYLRVVCIFALVRKVREEGARAAPCVDLRQSQRGRRAGRIAQRLQRGVADVDGVLYGLLPVRVLVAHRREDLVAVVAVHVADVRP